MLQKNILFLIHFYIYALIKMWKNNFKIITLYNKKIWLTGAILAEKMKAEVDRLYNMPYTKSIPFKKKFWRLVHLIAIPNFVILLIIILTASDSELEISKRIGAQPY